jgi:hypothetical protein
MRAALSRRQIVMASLPALGSLRYAPGLLAAETQPATRPAWPYAYVTNLFIRTVWTDGRHNGFPGIARVGNFYYVAFRNAPGHQAETDTCIIVVRSAADDLKHWEKVAEFRTDHDSRDPLLFENHGKVQVVWHSQEDYYSQSADGRAWTPQQLLDTDFPEPLPESKLVFKSRRRWLFRIRRGPDGAFYSLARCGIKESGGSFGLILYRSEDGIRFKAMHTFGQGPNLGFPRDGVGRGWGHEADVAWTPDGQLVCAIRTSRDGVIVHGTPPSGPWQSYATGVETFAGPALHATRQGGLLLAGRETGDRTGGAYPNVGRIWTVTPAGLRQPFTLPSGGDCAYQSFADGPGDSVLLAYYSSHEWPQPKGVGNNPANIYLAQLTVKHQKPA